VSRPYAHGRQTYLLHLGQHIEFCRIVNGVILLLLLIYYFAPAEERSVAISLSVCLCVCLCVCLRVCLYVCLPASISLEPLDQSSRNFVRRSLWPWLGPRLAVLRYVMHFLLCGWRHV